jgi:hypothetical protein
MKPAFIFILFFLTLQSFSQNCIDYIILKTDNGGVKTDTVFCKVISEDEEFIVIDNGHAISTLKKSLIENITRCARALTPYEIYKFQGLDAVTADMFNNQNTAGACLRKAARNAYLGAGMALVGSGLIVTGKFWVKNEPAQIACYITGGVTAAASLFFLIRGWNQIYRAGKLLDLSAQSALYLNTNQEGIGLSIKF